MKTEARDPLALDLLAAQEDRARIYFDYGRTEAIAHKKGGKFNVAKRAQHMKRVMDVLNECKMLDRNYLPPLRETAWFYPRIYRRK